MPSSNLFAVVLILNTPPLHAQDVRIFDNAPAARWIAPPGIPGDSFTVFHARKTFELSGAPTPFIVHVSADNRYRLYVNGTQVSSGPQRSDVNHWRYETLDLAPHLRRAATSSPPWSGTGAPRDRSRSTAIARVF